MSEPNIKRICVAPSVEHCLTAVPYYPGEKFSIYRTEKPVKASPATDVFDANITLEGWIQTPTLFTKIGTLSLPDVNDQEIIDEAAAGGSPKRSSAVLRWWQKRKLKQYIKKS